MEYNKNLNEKLNNVLALLDESKVEFESVENSVQDNDLKNIILSLIEENTKYTNELISNMGYLGLKKMYNNKSGSPFFISAESSNSFWKGTLLERCNRSETVFERAYQEALNSSFIQGNLRKMMQEQLNELKCILMKMRIRYLVKNNIVYPCSLHPKFRKHIANGKKIL